MTNLLVLKYVLERTVGDRGLVVERLRCLVDSMLKLTSPR